MLDPYWNPANEMNVVNRMNDMIWKHNISIEMTQSSSASSLADPVSLQKLMKLGASFSRIDPTYVDPVGIEFSPPHRLDPLVGTEMFKHDEAKTSYFLGIDPKNPNAPAGPSARTPNEVLKTVIDSGKYWRQTAGMSTETVMDDRYDLLDWANLPPPTTSSPRIGFEGFVLLNIAAWSLALCCTCCGCYHVTNYVRARRQLSTKAVSPH
jgi:hypothetical protein